MAWCHMPNNMGYVAAVYTACVEQTSAGVCLWYRLQFSARCYPLTGTCFDLLHLVEYSQREHQCCKKSRNEWISSCYQTHMIGF